MSVTQLYKKPNEFCLPAESAGLVRGLFEKRLAAVQEVLDDPDAPRILSRNDLEAIAFEALELARMLARMPRGVLNA